MTLEVEHHIEPKSLTNKDMENSYTVKEESFARRLGIGRDVLRLMRSEMLEKGSDWERVGREIYLTEEAANKVAERISSASEASDDGRDGRFNHPQEKPALALVPWVPEAKKIHTFKVYKATMNDKILLARDYNGELVRVRVHTSRNWLRNMEIKCTHISADLYELSGRCPRFRGRM